MKKTTCQILCLLSGIMLTASQVDAQTFSPPRESMDAEDREFLAVVDSQSVGTPSAQAYVAQKWLEFRIKCGDTVVSDPSLSKLAASCTSIGQARAELVINGHAIDVGDNLGDLIRGAYVSQRELAQSRLSDTLRRILGPDVSVSLPTRMPVIQFYQTGPSSGYVDINLYGANISYSGYGCAFSWNFAIKTTAPWILEGDSVCLKIKALSPRVYLTLGWLQGRPVTLIAQLISVLEDYCADVAGLVNKAVVATQILAGSRNLVINLNNFEHPVFTYSALNPVGPVTASDVNELRLSFPIRFRIATGPYPENRISIKLDFLEGREPSSTEFLGLVPDFVQNPSLDYLGFGLMTSAPFEDWANRPAAYPSIPECHDLVFQKMREISASSVRLRVPWESIVANVTLKTDAELQSLVGSTLESEVTSLLARSTWQNFDQVIEEARSRNLDVMLMIVQAFENWVPRLDNKPIAPNSGTQRNPTSFAYVDSSTFLWHLKVFAHATVRRYREPVHIWLAENELNAAGFAHKSVSRFLKAFQFKHLSEN